MGSAARISSAFEVGMLSVSAERSQKVRGRNARMAVGSWKRIVAAVVVVNGTYEDV